MARMLLGEHAMDLASVFDWFTQESTSAAEQTDEPRQREIWMKLSELWGGRRTTVPRGAIDVATRDAAVYLSIELIGGSLLKMKSPAQGGAKVRDECQW